MSFFFMGGQSCGVGQIDIDRGRYVFFFTKRDLASILCVSEKGSYAAFISKGQFLCLH